MNFGKQSKEYEIGKIKQGNMKFGKQSKEN